MSNKLNKPLYCFVGECEYTSDDYKQIKLSDGAPYCEFHCPLYEEDDDENGKKVVTEKYYWSKEKGDNFLAKVVANINKKRKPGEIIELYYLVTPYMSKLSLDGLTIDNEIQLSGSIFDRGITCRNTIFNDYASFAGANFGSSSDFRGARFKGDAGFEESTFDLVYFDDVKFDNSADFRNAVFNHDANFNNVEIKGEANFYNTGFSADATFKGAKFCGNVLFNGGTRNEEEHIKINSSFYKLDIECAKFINKGFVTNFSNRNYLDSTNLSKCIFCSAPQFHNSIFHQDTNFDNTEFRDYTSVYAARAYRTLKLAMEQHRAREEQSIFFALEQKCLRNKKNYPLSKKLFSWIYEKTSDYGRSFNRPISGLIIVWLMSLFMYCRLNGHYPYTSEFKEIVAFCVQQVVLPFSVWRIDIKNPPNWAVDNMHTLQLLATMQSMLSLFFIALLILAIRWQFRRG